VITPEQIAAIRQSSAQFVMIERSDLLELLEVSEEIGRLRDMVIDLRSLLLQRLTAPSEN
jgi:hypothetical protein